MLGYKRTFIFSCLCLIIFLTGCNGNSGPKAPTTSNITLRGTSGVLENSSEFRAEIYLTQMEGNFASFDSMNVFASLGYPACMFISAARMRVVSNNQTIYEKRDQQKIIIMPIIPNPFTEHKVLLVPEKQVVVEQGNAYVEFVFFTNVVDGSTLRDGTPVCNPFAPPDYEIPSLDDIESMGTELSKENGGSNFHLGKLRIDIPALHSSTPISESSEENEPSEVRMHEAIGPVAGFFIALERENVDEAVKEFASEDQVIGRAILEILHSWMKNQGGSVVFANMEYEVSNEEGDQAIILASGQVRIYSDTEEIIGSDYFDIYIPVVHRDDDWYISANLPKIWEIFQTLMKTE